VNDIVPVPWLSMASEQQASTRASDWTFRRSVVTGMEHDGETNVQREPATMIDRVGETAPRSTAMEEKAMPNRSPAEKVTKMAGIPKKFSRASYVRKRRAISDLLTSNIKPKRPKLLADASSNIETYNANGSTARVDTMRIGSPHSDWALAVQDDSVPVDDQDGAPLMGAVGCEAQMLMQNEKQEVHLGYASGATMLPEEDKNDDKMPSVVRHPGMYIKPTESLKGLPGIWDEQPLERLEGLSGIWDERSLERRSQLDTYTEVQGCIKSRPQTYYWSEDTDNKVTTAALAVSEDRRGYRQDDTETGIAMETDDPGGQTARVEHHKMRTTEAPQDLNRPRQKEVGDDYVVSPEKCSDHVLEDTDELENNSYSTLDSDGTEVERPICSAFSTVKAYTKSTGENADSSLEKMWALQSDVARRAFPSSTRELDKALERSKDYSYSAALQMQSFEFVNNVQTGLEVILRPPVPSDELERYEHTDSTQKGPKEQGEVKENVPPNEQPESPLRGDFPVVEAEPSSSATAVGLTLDEETSYVAGDDTDIDVDTEADTVLAHDEAGHIWPPPPAYQRGISSSHHFLLTPITTHRNYAPLQRETSARGTLMKGRQEQYLDYDFHHHSQRRYQWLRPPDSQQYSANLRATLGSRQRSERVQYPTYQGYHYSEHSGRPLSNQPQRVYQSASIFSTRQPQQPWKSRPAAHQGELHMHYQPQMAPHNSGNSDDRGRRFGHCDAPSISRAHLSGTNQRAYSLGKEQVHRLPERSGSFESNLAYRNLSRGISETRCFFRTDAAEEDPHQYGVTRIDSERNSWVDHRSVLRSTAMGSLLEEEAKPQTMVEENLEYDEAGDFPLNHHDEDPVGSTAVSRPANKLQREDMLNRQWEDMLNRLKAYKSKHGVREDKVAAACYSVRTHIHVSLRNTLAT